MHPPPNGSLTILGFSEVFLEQTILAVHERARRETKSCLFSPWAQTAALHSLNARKHGRNGLEFKQRLPMCVFPSRLWWPS